MVNRPGTLVFALALCAGALGLAHNAPALPDSMIAPPSHQFGLPFAGDPGPNSWMFIQAYGNTTGGYRRREADYRAGQGIHFGVDFGAPCGTPVRAIADGTVSEVDGPHGSPPHNLVLAHAGNLASLYGHLLKRSSLRVGERVRRGDVIGLSGDSQLTCISAPHLHLEIRDASHQRFFNPVLYLDTDWNTLSLAGGFGRGFQRDLDQPRRWQRLDDQPQAQRGGRLLNDFARPWPPAPGSPTQNWPSRIKAFTAPSPTATDDDISPEPRRITEAACCANPTWSADSSRVLFLDRPVDKSGNPAPTAIYGVDPRDPGTTRLAFSSLAFLSPSERYALLPGESSILERLSDGRRLRLPTDYGNLNFSPSEARVAWGVSQTRGNFDRLSTAIFSVNLSSTTGAFSASAPKRLLTTYGGGVVGWLDESHLVVTGKSSPTERDRALRVLDLQTGQSRVLARALNFRSLSISPLGRWIAYTIAFDSETRDGQFVIDTKSGQSRRVPWFGSYRWRDANRIVYVPLALRAASHNLIEFDARTSQSRALVDLKTRIENDQWQISPDGQRAAFVNAADHDLYALELKE